MRYVCPHSHCRGAFASALDALRAKQGLGGRRLIGITPVRYETQNMERWRYEMLRRYSSPIVRRHSSKTISTISRAMVFASSADNRLTVAWLREGGFRIVAIKGASREYREFLFSEVQIDDISDAPTYGYSVRTLAIWIVAIRSRCSKAIR